MYSSCPKDGQFSNRVEDLVSDFLPYFLVMGFEPYRTPLPPQKKKKKKKKKKKL